MKNTINTLVTIRNQPLKYYMWYNDEIMKNNFSKYDPSTEISIVDVVRENGYAMWGEELDRLKIEDVF